MDYKPMEIEELRERLERGENLTILDIRRPEDRNEWHIPGSIYHDAYDALKAGDGKILLGLPLPAHAPVVAVCYRGNTSIIAALQLEARGLTAYSLEGGMQAWSLAWNTAEISDGNTTVIQVRRTGKGCLSYLAGSRGEAAVIDPSLDAEIYFSLARQKGWTIRHVIDTHVHADHLTRSLKLAELAGAEYWLPEQKRVQFQHKVFRDNDTLTIGDATLRAIRTPGHTNESTCYCLNDRWLMTGDTLFPTSVGRPDLGADEEEIRRRAVLLHASLQKLLVLDSNLFVLAGHTDRPVPFDRKIVGETLGKVREAVKLPSDASAFAESVLRRIPPAPANHREIISFNEAGEFPEGDLTVLEAGANRCALR